MARYRILSMDGGGIRGLITAILLQRLSERPGLEGFIAQADLMAGTSTGGLIALALAHGMSLQTIRGLYETRAGDIFDDSWLDDVVDLGKLRGADYSLKPLRKELKRLFADTRLGDLDQRVLITTFDLDNEDPDQRSWKPKLFHNFPGPDSDAPQPVRDVALYTSAAPTYFPSADGFIDGGVFAPNPAMCALAQSQDVRSGTPPALDDVVLLSLGTGRSLVHIKGRELNWGYVQWAKPLLSLMLDGVSGIADYQCHQMLRERYHRQGPVFPAGTRIGMDAWKRIPEMIAFAYAVDLDETEAWLRAMWVEPIA